MGLWDWLFGAKKAAPAARQGPDLASGWLRWHLLGHAEQAAAVTAHLEGLLAGFGGLSVVRRKHDTEVLARGSVGPFKFQVRVRLADLDTEVEVKAPNPRGFIDLEWDPARSASDEDGVGYDPDWDDEDGEQRVFLAENVLIEGSDAAAEAASFRLLPAELQAELLAAMPRHRVRFLRMRPAALEMSLTFDAEPGVERLAPLPALLDLAARAGAALAVLPPPAEEDEDLDEGDAEGEDLDEDDETADGEDDDEDADADDGEDDDEDADADDEDDDEDGEDDDADPDTAEPETDDPDAADLDTDAPDAELGDAAPGDAGPAPLSTAARINALRST